MLCAATLVVLVKQAADSPADLLYQEYGVLQHCRQQFSNKTWNLLIGLCLSKEGVRETPDHSGRTISSLSNLPRRLREKLSLYFADRLPTATDEGIS
jgi:hypothetical protein